MHASFHPASAYASAASNLTATQVSEQLTQILAPLGVVPDSEALPLLDALDRILAQDVVSPIDVPAHDNSAMDGYVFDGAQLLPTASLVLRVVGTVLAGTPWTGPMLRADECLKIMTGAVIPEGLDTVIAHERATLRDDEHIEIAPATVRAGDNRRCRGEDLPEGAVALHQGQRLHPAALGLIASLGLDSVLVRRRLRVAYFSTGDEVLSPGTAARPGAVYDSNRFSVLGMLRRLGVQALDLGVCRDDPLALQTRLHEAAALADVVITSGGVSAGEADHTRAMLQQLGPVQFWRIAMRPGRPLAVGLLPAAPRPLASIDTPHAPAALPLRPTVLLALPGNPVAAMISFLVFVRPALLQLMGAQASPTPMLQARAGTALRKRPGRTEYQRALVSQAADGSLTAVATDHQGSGVLRSMVEANGLMVLEHERGDVQAGDLVSVMMLDALM